MKQTLITLLTLAAVGSYAQNPAPAPAQTRPIVLTGGTLHVGNGQVIPNGQLVFDKGIITAVGTAATPPANAEVINVSGKHIYPGFISPAATVGLEEIASVRATLDMEEVGELNPNVRSLIAYNTDSEIIPTIRNNGVLLTQAVPQGGTVTGRSSVMQTDGWNWQDAVLKKDDGIWLNWPGYFAREFDRETFTVALKKNTKRDAAIAALRATFGDAKAYTLLNKPQSVNLKLEAMRGLFDGKQNLYVRADYAKDIIEAVQFAKQTGVQKVVVVGGEEAYRVASFLKDNNVPVVLSALHRLPTREDDPVYLPYEMPSILQKAGVLVGLSYADEWWRTRNLAFQAGTAGGFGVANPEEALQLITANNAKILGIDQWVGTLEKGKHATLFVTPGDALDMRTNGVERAFIQGRNVNLDDRHKRLYHQYDQKYKAAK